MSKIFLLYFVLGCAHSSLTSFSGQTKLGLQQNNTESVCNDIQTFKQCYMDFLLQFGVTNVTEPYLNHEYFNSGLPLLKKAHSYYQSLDECVSQNSLQNCFTIETFQDIGMDKPSATDSVWYHMIGTYLAVTGYQVYYDNYVCVNAHWKLVDDNTTTGIACAQAKADWQLNRSCRMHDNMLHVCLTFWNQQCDSKDVGAFYCNVIYLTDFFDNIYKYGSEANWKCSNVCPQPLLEERKLQNHRPIWYFFLIGGAILVAVLYGFTLLIKRRNKERREKLKLIGDRKMFITTIATESQRYKCNLAPKTVDIWEVPLKLLDIHYKVLIGKGAFSIVHAGFLYGRAPVLDVHPSIALQEFVNCDVAVKTLPQHFDEKDKAVFLSEIRLMKDIGFHIHLVSMLGYNCSIQRPLLVMELAEQSLLHWLTNSRTSIIETEINVEKTLLSISWQVSDGMHYLSSKNFVHRDLAARNVLLNKEMKAMVSDFGLCHKLQYTNQVVTLPGGKLPLKWMALESLQDHQFSSKTDVWSFGVLLYEIFSLSQEPYAKLSGGELVTFLRDGNRLDQPRLANEQMYEFMKYCWKADPEQRPDFTRIQTILRGLLEDSVANYGYLTTTEDKTSDINDKTD